MRLVVDTNVIVAALRSPSGASSALLQQAIEGRFQPLLTVSLALEYEHACLTPELRTASQLEAYEIEAVISAFVAVSEPVEVHYLWRPQLRDPADEMVLEAAINGRAEALVTFNQRDFGIVPRRFGIAMATPQAILRRLGQ